MQLAGQRHYMAAECSWLFTALQELCAVLALLLRACRLHL